MGVRQELRDVFGDDYERRVGRVSGINKFVNPDINKEKFLKIREPMTRGEYSNFVQYVDEVQEVKGSDGVTTYITIVDGQGKKKENLPHSLTKNTASQIEGQVIKALNGREPDDDFLVTKGSIWKVKGVKNPVTGATPTGGEYGDVMHKLFLISLDGNVVGQVLAGGGTVPKEISQEDKAKYT